MKKISLKQPHVLFIIAAVVITAFFIVLNVFHPNSAKAEVGDIAVTVNREAGLGALPNAEVFIQCTGGTFASIGTTDENGSLVFNSGLTVREKDQGMVPGATQGNIPVEADCQDGDAITIRVSAPGYVIKQTDGSDVYTQLDVNSYTVNDVQFALKINSEREGDNTSVPGASITVGSNNIACNEVTPQRGEISPVKQVGDFNNNASSIYYCALPFDQDGGDKDISFKADGYVSDTNFSTPDRQADDDAQAEVTLTDLKFQLKVVVNDELENPINDATVALDGNPATFTKDNNYYFAYAVDGSALSIKKAGYVNNEVTNEDLKNLSTSSDYQKTIHLGVADIASPIIVPVGEIQGKGNSKDVDDHILNVKGLEFSQKIVLNSEAEESITPTSVVIKGHDNGNGDAVIDNSGDVIINQLPPDQLGNPEVSPQINNNDCVIEKNIAYCAISPDQDGFKNDITIKADGFVDNNNYGTVDRNDETSPQGVIEVSDLQYAYKIERILAEDSLNSSEKKSGEISKQTIQNDLTNSVDTLEIGEDKNLVACIFYNEAWYCPLSTDYSQNEIIAHVSKNGYVEKYDYSLDNGKNRNDSSNDQVTDAISNIQYGVKVNLLSKEDGSAIKNASVVTGVDDSVSCLESSAGGTYFCPVGVSGEKLSIKASADSYTDATIVYANRENQADEQLAIDLEMEATSSATKDKDNIDDGNVQPQTDTTQSAIDSNSAFIFINNVLKLNKEKVASNNALNVKIKENEILLKKFDKESQLMAQITADKIPDEVAKKDITVQEAASQKIVDKIVEPTTSPDTKAAVSAFIISGTESTVKLGAGERAGVVNSFKEVYDRLPSTQADWNSTINIANGNWPTTLVPDQEKTKTTTFQKIYNRAPDTSNENDRNALVIMTYGLRPAQRSIVAEKRSLTTFVASFNRLPKSANDWNILRAIAYSGVKKQK